MSVIPQPRATDKAATDWAAIGGRAPGVARTMGRYLDQLATFLAPTSVDAADNALRQFAAWLLAHTDVRVVADIGSPVLDVAQPQERRGQVEVVAGLHVTRT